MSDPKGIATAKPYRKLLSASFSESIPFDNEAMSVQLGRNADDIFPAILGPAGDAIQIEKGQRADGLAIQRRTTNLNTHETLSLQVFVPWANVKGLVYGP